MADDDILDSPWKRALAATGGFFMGGGDDTEDSKQPQEIPANVKASNRIEDTPAPARRGGSPQPDPSIFQSVPQPQAPQQPLHPPGYADLSNAIQAEQARLASLNQPAKITLKQRLMNALGGAGAQLAGPQATAERAAAERQGQQQQFDERQSLAARIAQQQQGLSSEEMQTARMQEEERMREVAEQAQWDRLQATLGGRMQQIGAQQEGANQRTQLQQTGAMGRTQLQQQSALDRLKQTQQYGIWKTNQDNATKMRVAELTAGKAPAALVQTAVFARGGLSQMADAQQAMQQLQQSGAMGSLPANWVETYLFGNGMVDPRLDPQTRQAIGRLRSALTYTSSAAMRAHTGRTSQEIYEDFKKGLGPGQDWDALRGAIEETGNMLGQYADAASGANMNAIRAGQPSPKAPAPTPQQAPSQGRVIRID